VADLQFQSGEASAGADLHLAAGVAGGEDVSVSFAYVVQLFL
jgi:hypothetical protein